MRLGVALGSAALLLWLPCLERDWPTLGAVSLGSLICLNYSIPLLGFRFKNVPLLKTLFAPSIVLVSILGLPWLHLWSPRDSLQFAINACPAWGILLFNMTLCDLRDIEGDRSTGVRSLAVLLGAARTRLLLLALLAGIELLSLACLVLAPPALRLIWLLMVVFVPLYLGCLLLAVRAPRSERFYEWWVEGMLFLPAAACLAAMLPSHPAPLWHFDHLSLRTSFPPPWLILPSPNSFPPSSAQANSSASPFR